VHQLLYRKWEPENDGAAVWGAALESEACLTKKFTDDERILLKQLVDKVLCNLTE
jgi:hypothetical protein